MLDFSATDVLKINVIYGFILGTYVTVFVLGAWYFFYSYFRKDKDRKSDRKGDK